MAKSGFQTSSESEENWILLGIPFVFVVGSIMHFVYEWSGKLPVVGIFCPINESVWEHLKMAFWPMLFWWVLGYFILNRRKGISASQWFTSCTVAVIACLLIIVSFYYTYTGALGIHSLTLDIFSFFLGIALGQVLGLHIYNYAKLSRSYLYISLTILFLLAAAFVVFTFDPPDLPLFIDPRPHQ